MIEKLLAQNEGQTLEFKESTKSLLPIIKAVVAFANTAGGVIVIGVEDKSKKIIGIEGVLDEEERLVNAISDSIEPFLVPDIEIQNFRNKELIIINIPHTAGPFYIKSEGPEKGVYIRSGSTNRRADLNMLENLKLYARKISFDEKACLELQTVNLDWDLIKKVFSWINKEPNTDQAYNLGLLVDYFGRQYPSNGAVILFAKNRLSLFPDAHIKCVRFKGKNKSEMQNYLDINGYLINGIEEAINFIENHTRTGIKIGRIKRVEFFQYPLQAIREAVINAVVHTDYAIQGSSIMISIFDDRLEITNPGGIPLGITLERALAGASRVRNRVIARVFRELKIIEQWGSGLQRIIESCLKYGLKKPLFEDFYSEFVVTLYAEKEKETNLYADKKILVDYLNENERISTQEAAKLWKIVPRTARTKLKYLVEEGLIKRIGLSLKDPYGVYVLTSKIW